MTKEQSKTETLLRTKARCVLVDIEGTTSSIAYVYDVLFPYAKTELPGYLRDNWHSPEVKKAIDYLAKDLGHSDADQWFKKGTSTVQSDPDSVGDPDRETDKLTEKAHQQLVLAEVERLMASDVKSTGLKELQGLVWAVGYNQGKLLSHVFSDVPVAFKAWREAGVDIRIFSSGSINAQKVFFKHTEYGALSEYLLGHYDTTTGPKREANSYRMIADDISLEPGQILFLSDIEAELEAAYSAGMQVGLVVRPGNAPTQSTTFAQIESFDQISLHRTH
jgi:enolase-phosphatase E1